MSNQISIKAEPREIVGKGLGQIRADGKVPAVIHDQGNESIVINLPYIDMVKVYKEAGRHHPVTVDVDGKKHLTIIKDTDFEPKKQMLRHVVFGTIRQDEKVETEVPVVLVGEIPAEKASLLVLTQHETISVEGLPKDLIDTIEVDATSLAEAGDKITVADIKPPIGIEIITDPETVLATVEVPRDQVAEADAAAEEMAQADAAGVPADQGEASEDDQAESSESSEEKPAAE